MKFGKTLNQKIKSYEKIIYLPIFPYKKMKKVIKNNKSFIEYVEAIKKLDNIWTRKSLFLLNTSRLFATQNMKKKACYLIKWADLYKEATRKILKKYNKHRRNHEFIKNNFSFNFQQSYIRIELEGLSNIFNISNHCSVCLEPLFMPLSKECGHLICRQCFPKIKHENCPVCRGKGKWKHLYHLSHFVNRYLDSQQRLDEYICEKYKTKLRKMSLIQLTANF
tara:strand:+ start:315 stop:980 length:666 start_codon:yes stop_codon:yes gene_type:complete